MVIRYEKKKNNRSKMYDAGYSGKSSHLDTENTSNMGRNKEMTKKLSDWEKDQHKMRRSALIQIKKLLKNKSVMIDYRLEYKIQRDRNHNMFHTGERELILNWVTKK